MPVNFSLVDVRGTSITELEVGSVFSCVYTYSELANTCVQMEKPENFNFLMMFMAMFPTSPTAKECQAAGHNKNQGGDSSCHT